jgi:hypothetical protein
MTRTPAGSAYALPAESSRHFRPSSWLLRRNRDAEPLTTLGSSTLEDVTPPGRRHASEETMGSLTARITWLKSSLHWGVGLSITADRSCQFVTQMPRQQHPSACRALRISNRSPAVSGTLRLCRFCSAPLAARPVATFCSVARSSFCRPRLLSNLRTCKYPSTYELLLPVRFTDPNQRAIKAAGIFHIPPCMASYDTCQSSVGADVATW